MHTKQSIRTASLEVIPIFANRTQKKAGAFMVKPSIVFDVSRERGYECVAFRCDPIEYGTL